MSASPEPSNGRKHAGTMLAASFSSRSVSEDEAGEGSVTRKRWFEGEYHGRSTKARGSLDMGGKDAGSNSGKGLEAQSRLERDMSICSTRAGDSMDLEDGDGISGVLSRSMAAMASRAVEGMTDDLLPNPLQDGFSSVNTFPASRRAGADARKQDSPIPNSSTQQKQHQIICWQRPPRETTGKRCPISFSKNQEQMGELSMDNDQDGCKKFQLGVDFEAGLHYKDAEHCYLEAIHILTMTNPTDKMIGQAYGNLGSIYAKIGRYEESIVMCEQCLEFFKGLRADLTASRLISSDSSGNDCEVDDGRISEGVACEAMGEAFASLDMIPQAILRLEDAIFCFMEAKGGIPQPADDGHGETDPRVANVERKIVDMYARVQLHDPDEAMKIFSATVPPLVTRGKGYEQGIARFKAGLHCFQSQTSANAEVMDQIVIGLACMYRYIQEDDKALMLFQEALRTKSTERPSGGIDLLGMARALSGIGGIHLKQRRLHQAHRALLEAGSIFQASLGFDAIDVANNLQDLGAVYHLLGQLDLAIGTFSQGLEIYKKNLVWCHPVIGDTLGCIGIIYSQKNDHAEAIKHFQDGLMVHEAGAGLGTREAACMFYDLASSQHEIGDVQAAFESCGSSLRIFEELGISGDVVSRSTELRELLACMRDSTQAGSSRL